DERLGPADAVEAPGGQEVVRGEQRREPQLLRAGREPPDLAGVPLRLAGQQVRRQADAQLHVRWPSRGESRAGWTRARPAPRGAPAPGAGSPGPPAAPAPGAR